MGLKFDLSSLFQEKEQKEKVEVFPAYTWICNDCGKRNFQKTFLIEDIENKNKVDIFRVPAEVKCEHCKKVYRATGH